MFDEKRTAKGLTLKEIAEDLDLSIEEVENSLNNE